MSSSSVEPVEAGDSGESDLYFDHRSRSLVPSCFEKGLVGWSDDWMNLVPERAWRVRDQIEWAKRVWRLANNLTKEEKRTNAAFRKEELKQLEVLSTHSDSTSSDGRSNFVVSQIALAKLTFLHEPKTRHPFIPLFKLVMPQHWIQEHARFPPSSQDYVEWVERLGDRSWEEVARAMVAEELKAQRTAYYNAVAELQRNPLDDSIMIDPYPGDEGEIEFVEAGQVVIDVDDDSDVEFVEQSSAAAQPQNVDPKAAASASSAYPTPPQNEPTRDIAPPPREIDYSKPCPPPPPLAPQDVTIDDVLDSEEVQPEPRQAKAPQQVRDQFAARERPTSFTKTEPKPTPIQQQSQWNRHHEAHLVPFFAGELGPGKRHWSHSPSLSLPKKRKPSYHLTNFSLLVGRTNTWSAERESFESSGGKRGSVLLLLDKLTKPGTELSGRAARFFRLKQFEESDLFGVSDDDEESADAERAEDESVQREVILKSSDIIGLEIHWRDGVWLETRQSLFRLESPCAENPTFAALWCLFLAASFNNIRGQHLASIEVGADYIKRAMNDIDWGRWPRRLVAPRAQMDENEAKAHLTPHMCEALYRLLPSTPWFSPAIASLLVDRVHPHLFRVDDDTLSARVLADRERDSARASRLQSLVDDFDPSQAHSTITGSREMSWRSLPLDKEVDLASPHQHEVPIRKGFSAEVDLLGDGTTILKLKAGDSILVIGTDKSYWCAKVLYFYQTCETRKFDPLVRIHVAWYLRSRDVFFGQASGKSLIPSHVLFASKFCGDLALSTRVVKKITVHAGQLAPPISDAVDSEFYCCFQVNPHEASVLNQETVENFDHLPNGALDLLRDTANGGARGEPDCFGCALEHFDTAVKKGPFVVVEKGPRGESCFNVDGVVYTPGCFVFAHPGELSTKRANATAEDGDDGEVASDDTAVEPLLVGWLVPWQSSKKEFKKGDLLDVVWFQREIDLVPDDGRSIRTNRALVRMDTRAKSVIRVDRLAGRCFVEHKSSLMKHYAADLTGTDDYNLTIALARLESEDKVRANSFFVTSSLDCKVLGDHANQIAKAVPLDPRSLRKFNLKSKLKPLRRKDFNDFFADRCRSYEATHLERRAEQARARALLDEKRYKANHTSFFTGIAGLDGALCSGNRSLVFTTAVEKDPAPSRAIKQNHPECKNVLNEAVSDVNEAGELSALTWTFSASGGFPCQSHSTLNKHKRPLDVRPLEAYTFLDAVRAERPAWGVAENVRAILDSPLPGDDAEDGDLVRTLIAGLTLAGYQTRQTIVNAASYGSAQVRRRWILTFALIGLELAPVPDRTHAYREAAALSTINTSSESETCSSQPSKRLDGHAPHRAVGVSEVLDDLPPFEHEFPTLELERLGITDLPPLPYDPTGRTQFKYEHAPLGFIQPEKYTHALPRNASTRQLRIPDPFVPGGPVIESHVADHYSASMPPLLSAALHYLAQGANYESLPKSLQQLPPRGASARWRETFGKGWLRRIDPAAQSTPLKTSAHHSDGGSRIHYREHRLFSVRELARLQGIPDKTLFRATEENTIIQFLRMIGNSVPHSIGSAVSSAQFAKWIPRILADADAHRGQPSSGNLWFEIRQEGLEQLGLRQAERGRLTADVQQAGAENERMSVVSEEDDDVEMADEATLRGSSASVATPIACITLEDSDDENQAGSL